MMRGLFGRSMPGPTITGFGGGTFNMDGSLPDMASIPTTAGGRFGNPMPQQQMPRQSFWQGGSKFTGRDAIAGALAAIGDGLRGWAGGPTGAVEGLLGGRERAAAIAEQQRAQAERMAAAQRLGYTPDQVAILGGELAKVQAGRMDNPAPPKPGSFEWFQTATPEQRSEYDRFNPVVATTWQGPTIVPRSSLGGAVVAPVGRLTPIQPSIANTPAPQVGANGMPTTLTRQQYQAVVNSMGVAGTEAWARRNNIKVID